jgi:hypothetical protein
MALINFVPRKVTKTKYISDTADIRILYFIGLCHGSVSRHPLTTKAWAQSQASVYGICGGQIDTGTGFTASILVLSCQYFSTIAPYSFIM